MIDVRHIDAAIAEREEQIRALQTARSILTGDAAPAPLKALPAPGKKRAPKRPKPATAQAPAPAQLFDHEIDGITIQVTEQQQAFLGLLSEHDFVSRKMALPIFDNSFPAFAAAFESLAENLQQHSVPAVIKSYKGPGRGYRLEVKE